MVKDKGRGKQLAKSENNGLGRSNSKDMGVILILENWSTFCVPWIVQTSQLVLKNHYFYSWPEDTLSN